MKIRILKPVISLLFLLIGLVTSAQFDSQDAEVNRAGELYIKYYDSNQDSAIYYLKRAMAISTQIKDYANVIWASELLSEYHIIKNREVEGLNQGLTTLKLAYEHPIDSSTTLRVLTHISGCYLSVLDVAKAEKYFLEAMPYLSKTTREGPKVSFLNTGGRLYYNLEKYHKSIEYAQKVVKINFARPEMDTAEVSEAYLNIARSYKELGQYDMALKYWDWALKIDTAEGSLRNIAIDYENIAELYIYGLKKQDKGIVFLDLAAKTFDAIGELKYQYNIFNMYAEIYMKQKNYKLAAEYLLKYKDSYDLYLQLSRRDEIDQLEAQFAAERKERDIQRLMELQKAQDKELASHKIRNTLIGIILIVVFLLLVATAVAYRNSRKLSRYFMGEDERKELLLREVHHRMNNSLQLTTSLLSLQADSSKHEETREALLQCATRIHAMARLHDLLNENATKSELNLNDYLEDILRFHRNVTSAQDHVKVSSKIANVNFDGRRALPLALIMNELVTNCLKYAFPDGRNGEIVVEFIRDNQKCWILNVKDDGVGFKQEEDSERKEGMGLNVARILSRQLGSELKILPADVGTHFQLVMPDFRTVHNGKNAVDNKSVKRKKT